MIRRQTAAHAGADFVEVEVDADARHALRLHQIIQQDAAAATEVEDAGVGIDPGTDTLHVDRSLFDLAGH